MAEKADPIGIWTKITEDNGSPTAFFVQQWNSQLNVNAYAFNNIVAGEGLTGGGALADGEVTLNLETLDPAPTGTYGSATEVPVITVDKHGRTTLISTATVAATVAVEDDGVSVETGATTLNFTGTGVAVTNPTAGQVDIAIAGGGGGSSSQKFVSYVPAGENPWQEKTTINQVARAQGYNVDVYEECTVEGFYAGVSPSSASPGYVVVVCEMTNASDSATVVAITGTTEVPAGFSSGDDQVLYFPFTTPITLEKGKVYFFGVQTDGGGADPRHAFWGVTDALGIVQPQGPMVALGRWRRFDPTAPAVSDGYGSSGNGSALIWPVGTW